MRHFSPYEKKQILLGILLMSGLITLYNLLTLDSSNTFVFRWFFPIFWGIFSLMVIGSLIGYRGVAVGFSSNAWIFRAANFLSVLTMLVGYFISVRKEVGYSFIRLRETYFTAAICILIFMYVYGAFKEKACDIGIYGDLDDLKYNSLDDMIDLMKSSSEDSRKED